MENPGLVIGPYQFTNNIFLAPMAGITDLPFRQLVLSLGAGHAISEMTSTRPELLHTRQSQLRRAHHSGLGPVHVQIAGYDPEQMSVAAQFHVQQGADMIDINMGCPAKKVCNRLSGSALLRDEGLVKEILQAVVGSVSVPVTLKTRTGWDRDSRNAIKISALAEQAGIAAFTLHGRTRCDFYKGKAEHQTLAEVKKNLSIPVIANGDVDSLCTAQQIIDQTGADGIMIGRAAQQQPWLPGNIAQVLSGNPPPPLPNMSQKHAILSQLVRDIHQFYGEAAGLRMARKHIAWQIEPYQLDRDQRNILLRAENTRSQIASIDNLFQSLGSNFKDPDRFEQQSKQDHDINLIQAA